MKHSNSNTRWRKFARIFTYLQMENNRYYVSTRSNNVKASASEAITRGLAPDGGLYVPAFIDDVHFDLNELKDLSYPKLAVQILSEFLDFTPEQLDACIQGAYCSGKFDTDSLVKTVDIQDASILELHHGPTSAFKDMALTILPYLMTTASANCGEDRKIAILTATSGDTGKAALEGFKNVPGTKIIVYYPKDGVSPIQEAQMLTTGGSNTRVIGVDGNFDDTQTGVKKIFGDSNLADRLSKAGWIFSSANSINIGRLLPQIVYYYYTYFDLVREGKLRLGEPVNFSVPTGNFGDILAGYYAGLTGLPVNKLICASNSNNVLTDFFENGEYNRNREFYKTISPSMDILISSNLERLLYDKLGRNADSVAELMNKLSADGSYQADKSLFPEFYAGYANEAETKAVIKRVFESDEELIDPHTAVAEKVRADYAADTGDKTRTVVLSTASPYKFARPVYEAVFGEVPGNTDDFAVQDELFEESHKDIPSPLTGLADRAVRHHTVCTKEQMADEAVSFLTED